MLAELVDAVVGVDTHRDSHEVEIALPSGIAIGTCKISNDSNYSHRARIATRCTQRQ